MLTSEEQVTDRLIAGLRRASMRSRPWRYAHLEGAIPAGMAHLLADCFDRLAMSRCEQRRAEKSYRFSNAPLSADSPIDEGPWKAVVQGLLSRAYRDAMSMLTGVDLEESEVTLHMWEYREGDWLAPHVDKAEKLVTQVIYLTEGWHEGAGGRLMILESDDPSSVVDRIAPRFGDAIILVRSESSWHAVEAVAPAGRPRRSVTVTYWSTRRGTGDPSSSSRPRDEYRSGGRLGG